ncbi:hypothetical protein BLSTO_04199 [Blastocystis sp. subtype 1]
MITGMVEYWVEFFFVPALRMNVFSLWIGLSLCLAGGLLRACSEIQMKNNFNHMIQTEKTASHQLVTTGIYSYLRHPAYTGWFYFSIGTQVLLNNPFCSVAYAIASWYFFYVRIPIEEKYLLGFFSDYEAYRSRTHIFIPFIPMVHLQLASFSSIFLQK